MTILQHDQVCSPASQPLVAEEDFSHMLDDDGSYVGHDYYDCRLAARRVFNK